MDRQIQLGAVLIGGYLLGRTKKGGMAIRIASRMMLSSANTDPKELVRDNALRLLQSEVVEQFRDQMMEAAKAAVDARVQGLAQNLTDRTEALKNPVTDTAGDATTKGTDALKKVTGSKDEEKEDADQAEAEGEEPVDETAGGAGEEDESTDDVEEPDDEQSDQEDSEAEGEAEEPEAEDEGAEEGDSEADEGDQDGDDSDDQAWIETRAKDLKRKRITTLRNMAEEMFEDEDIENASKDDLARWIAEAEAEDKEDD